MVVCKTCSFSLKEFERLNWLKLAEIIKYDKSSRPVRSLRSVENLNIHIYRVHFPVMSWCSSLSHTWCSAALRVCVCHISLPYGAKKGNERTSEQKRLHFHLCTSQCAFSKNIQPSWSRLQQQSYRTKLNLTAANIWNTNYHSMLGRPIVSLRFLRT